MMCFVCAEVVVFVGLMWEYTAQVYTAAE